MVVLLSVVVLFIYTACYVYKDNCKYSSDILFPLGFRAINLFMHV